ncbi:MAG: polysaccharide biosynthesis/export family protein [Candidatus Zhuqueibacterota bacterium]
MKNVFKGSSFWESVSFLFIAFIMSNYSTGLSQTGQKVRTEFYPGDAVQIYIVDVGQISEKESFNISNDYTINNKGYIMLPLVGEVKVVGHDRFSLAKYLMDKFSPFFKEPYIITTPLMRVTLMGAFQKPGAYRVSPESSLWELIELAEGPNEDCDLKSLRVERGGKVIMKNLLEQFEKGYSLEEIGVKTGDQIIARTKKTFSSRDIVNYGYFIISSINLYLYIRDR